MCYSVQSSVTAFHMCEPEFNICWRKFNLRWVKWRPSFHTLRRVSSPTQTLGSCMRIKMFPMHLRRGLWKVRWYWISGFPAETGRFSCSCLRLVVEKRRRGCAQGIGISSLGSPEISGMVCAELCEDNVEDSEVGDNPRFLSVGRNQVEDFLNCQLDQRLEN